MEHLPRGALPLTPLPSNRVNSSVKFCKQWNWESPFPETAARTSLFAVARGRMSPRYLGKWHKSLQHLHPSLHVVKLLATTWTTFACFLWDLVGTSRQNALPAFSGFLIFYLKVQDLRFQNSGIYGSPNTNRVLHGTAWFCTFEFPINKQQADSSIPIHPADSTCEKARSRQRQDLAPTLGRVARARTVLTAEQAIDP